MRDVLKLCGVAFIAIAALMLFFMAIVVPLSAATCKQYANLNTQYEYKFAFLPGCVVKYNGVWISAGNFNAVLLESK